MSDRRPDSVVQASFSENRHSSHEFSAWKQALRSLSSSTSWKPSMEMEMDWWYIQPEQMKQVPLVDEAD